MTAPSSAQLATEVYAGISPRRHHDSSVEVGDLHVRYSARLSLDGPFDLDVIEGDQKYDDLGGYFWEPESRVIGTWSRAFPALVTGLDAAAPFPTCEEERNGSFVPRRGAPASDHGVLPQRAPYEADVRYRELEIDELQDDWLPRWPGDWPGVVLGGTEEYSEEPVFVAGFAGLVAPTAQGDPELGTRVWDLTDTNTLDRERYRELQSLVSVVDLGGGSCGVAGKVLALNLGHGGRNEPGRAGYHVMTDWDHCTYGLFAQLHGGGPFVIDEGGCQHKLARAPDGNWIHPGHLHTRTLFKNGAKDASLGFQEDAWQETVAPGPFWLDVALRYKAYDAHAVCDRLYPGRWRWEVTSYLAALPPPYPPWEPPPPPEDDDEIVPDPYEEPEDGVKDPPPRRPYTGTGLGSNPDGTHPLVGGSSHTPAYPTAQQCVALPGVRFRGTSTQPGEPDPTGSNVPMDSAVDDYDDGRNRFSEGEFPNDSAVDDADNGDPNDFLERALWSYLFRAAPNTGSLTGFAQGGGSWTNFSTVTDAHGYTHAEGGFALHPSSVGLGELFAGDASSALTATHFVVPPGGIASIDFGWPSRQTGSIAGGVRLEAGAGSTLEIAPVDAAGVASTTQGISCGASSFDYDGVHEFLDGIYCSEIGTPSTPSAGTGVIYFKADGKPYALSATLSETDLTTGGGGGGGGDHSLASAATNTVEEVVAIQHQTSDTAAAGFGARMVWELENDAGALHEAARIDVFWEDPTAAAEYSGFEIAVFDDGDLIFPVAYDLSGSGGASHLVLQAEQMTVAAVAQGIEVFGDVDITGKLTVSGRIDPVSLEFTDVSGSSQIPNPGRGFEYDSTVDAARPTWQINGVQTAVALLSDVAANALLDGTVHSDTAAATVSRGSLIVGSSAPLWDELTVGAANTVVGSDGTDTTFRTITSLLDGAFGSTAGQVLYRGSSAWVATSAPSADDQVLTWDAGGSSVGWETAAGGGGDHVVTDTNTNTSVEVVNLQHDLSSGNAAAGFGAHLNWVLDNDAGTALDACRFDVAWADPLATTEDATLSIQLYDAGGRRERFSLHHQASTLTSYTTGLDVQGLTLSTDRLGDNGAAGLGAGVFFEGKNGSGSLHPMGSVECVYTDATSTAEDADLVSYIYIAGSEVELLRLDASESAVYTPQGLIQLEESASAPTTPAAGRSTIWVADAGQPKVTNDTGLVSHLAARPVREMPAVNYWNTFSNIDARNVGISYGRLGLLRVSNDSGDGYVNNNGTGAAFGTERVGNGTGHQTSYVENHVIDDPAACAFYIHWRVPEDWPGFDSSAAIRWSTKAATVPSGNGGIVFSVIVYDPDDGSVVTTQTRTATATETAYDWVTVTASHLSGVSDWAGKLLKIKIKIATEGVFDFGSNVARWGEFEINPA